MWSSIIKGDSSSSSFGSSRDKPNCESEISVAIPQVSNNFIMNKYVDYFYRQPTCTYYTYYDYLVVIDFEATCDNTRNENPRPIRHERPEIIQFPAILVNVRTMEVEGIFNSIVRPVEAPTLSEFCTCLTGITQNMVKKAQTFPQVLRRFEAWLKSYGIALNNQEYGHSFAIVTDGSYDMGHFLYKQCIISQIPYPTYATRWVNIRTIFTKVYRRRWGCLKAALEFLSLPFEGRAHNGLDDSKNICKVLMQFLRAGCIIYQTEKILLQPGEQERNEERILNDKAAGKYDLATVAPVSSKEFEHICVYSTDAWSTHRCVPPEVSYAEVIPEVSYDSASESMGLVSTSSESSCSSSYYNQPSTSGSCESIASGCSNKENSIPLYIPTGTTTNKATGSMKARASSASLKEVAIVSANGPGGDSSTDSSSSSGGRGGNHETVVSFASSVKAGRRKKRNTQLKDHHHHSSSSSVGGTNFTKASDESAVSNVGPPQAPNGSDGSIGDVSHQRQSKTTLESTGTQTTHLQPLVSDLCTEE